MTQAIKSVVIVGGGTAGWMAAASLQHHFANTGLKFTVVDSSSIGTIGVGEATIPTIRRFYANLGLSDREVMRATQATVKLGIQFNDWHSAGSSFIHPFGLFGQDLRGIGFHHFWKKLRERGSGARLGEYSLGASLAVNEKFTPPSANPPSSLSVFDWALHLDASLFAEFLRDYAMRRGCSHIDSIITRVNLRREDGFIESLLLESGQELQGDLFIDCSGFRGLLIEEALHTGYENWSHWLRCDSAYAVQTESLGTPPPYTRVDAQGAGWQWRIPLRHRTGNGHVYSSSYMDDQRARDVLLENLQGRLLHEPRKLSFVPGRRKRAWNKNCIALGLAAGFLEPLESTSIALIETGIERIKMLFPDLSFNPHCIDEFNEMTAEEYERVRDFIILHYKGTARSDTEFWRDCAAADIPATLEKKIELFRARGHFVKYRWEMFHPASWLAIYEGFDILPQGYDPGVDAFDTAYVEKSLAAMHKSLRDAVAGAPSHQQFLDELYSNDKAEMETYGSH